MNEEKRGDSYSGEVSMMVIGTRSGNMSEGRRVGGRTGGTFSGKISEATVTIRLDFPVPGSPTTTMRTLQGRPGFAAAKETAMGAEGGERNSLQMRGSETLVRCLWIFFRVLGA